MKGFRRHACVALPVVNEESRLLGVVSYDDILDVSSREQTEDIQKLGGSEALKEPYLTIFLLQMVKKRAGWLVILIFGRDVHGHSNGLLRGRN